MNKRIIIFILFSVALMAREELFYTQVLHLGSANHDLDTRFKEGKQTQSHCQGGFIDKAGF